MSWNTLQAQVHRMGFEVAFRTLRDEQGGFMPDLTPPKGPGWILVGCYDHVASFWVKPLSDATRKLNGNLVRKLMAEYDPFIGTVAEDDVDYSIPSEPVLANLRYLEKTGTSRPELPAKRGLSWIVAQQSL